MRILIVEDTESISHMIAALVKAKGHTVYTAANGSKALDIATTELPFDTILLDINLPGTLDGFDVCTKLRADARFAETQIFFISALLADPEYQARATAVGATGFFPKPFSPLALLRELEKQQPTK
jgi:DNA-binding response OmpR family regulator